MSEKKIKLSGFNNLTKVLSFNLYDFCIALDESQKKEYIKYINECYSGRKILEISKNICEIIKADILAVSEQDYDPVGASAMTLMSDVSGGGWNHLTPQVSMHLDKSHITAHTYPDAQDPLGICSFRVDIDIATCGEILPIDAINYLFEAFECDIVYIDYVVRGYTRLKSGQKIYNDHKFDGLQEFISDKVLENYTVGSEINLPQNNIWQTKLMVNDFNPLRYLMEPERDKNHPLIPQKMELLKEEMKQVFHLIH